MLGPNNRSFLVALQSTCTHTYFFFKEYPFKSWNKNDSIPNIQNYLGAFSEYAEWICTYTENTQNESFHILRIPRKNLYVFGEYAEWGNIQTKFCCSYTDNTRNESVRILRICGMNLFVYWEYAEWICTFTENTRNARKIEYLGKFETKIKNILGCLSGA